MNSVNYNFPVEKQDLKLQSGASVKGKKVLVRPDTDTCLGIVSNHYKPTLHKDVIELFDRIPNLNREKVSLGKEGAVMLADYGFTNQVSKSKAEVVRGDIVDFKLRAFNSYNRSMELGFEIRALRLVCTNGLVIPKAVSRIGQRHMGNKDINNLSENIFGKLENLSSVVDKWRIWNELETTETKTLGFFKYASIGKRTKKLLLDDCLSAENIWKLYNVFTTYTSHKLKFKKNSDEELRRHTREQDLLKKFYNYNWVN